MFRILPILCCVMWLHLGAATLQYDIPLGIRITCNSQVITGPASGTLVLPNQVTPVVQDITKGMLLVVRITVTKNGTPLSHTTLQTRWDLSSSAWLTKSMTTGIPDTDFPSVPISNNDYVSMVIEGVDYAVAHRVSFERPMYELPINQVRQIDKLGEPAFLSPLPLTPISIRYPVPEGFTFSQFDVALYTPQRKAGYNFGFVGEYTMLNALGVPTTTREDARTVIITRLYIPEVSLSVPTGDTDTGIFYVTPIYEVSPVLRTTNLDYSLGNDISVTVLALNGQAANTLTGNGSITLQQYNYDFPVLRLTTNTATVSTAHVLVTEDASTVLDKVYGDINPNVNNIPLLTLKAGSNYQIAATGTPHTATLHIIDPANSGNITPTVITNYTSGSAIDIHYTRSLTQKLDAWSSTGTDGNCEPIVSGTTLTGVTFKSRNANYYVKPKHLSLFPTPLTLASTEPGAVLNSSPPAESGIVSLYTKDSALVTAPDVPGRIFLGWSIAGSGWVISYPEANQAQVIAGEVPGTLTANYGLPPISVDFRAVELSTNQEVPLNSMFLCTLGDSGANFSFSKTTAPGQAANTFRTSTGFSYPQSEQVTITTSVLHHNSYRFVRWSGTLGNNETTNSLSLAPVTGTLVANFERIYSVTVNPATGGTVSTQAATVAAGGVFTTTAIPDPGMYFLGWQGTNIPSTNNNITVYNTERGVAQAVGAGISLGTAEPSLSITVNSNTVLTPIFGPYPAPHYQLTVTPANHYTFQGWSVADATVLPGNPTVVYGWGELHIQPLFKPVQYPITVVTSGEGTTDATGVTMADYGSFFQVTATGTDFFGWTSSRPDSFKTARSLTTSLSITSSSGGVTTPSPGIYNRYSDTPRVITKVEGPTTLTACFGLPSYQLQATPATGYVFVGWQISGNARLASATTEPTNTISGTGALQASAVFLPQNYSYTVNVIGNGSVTPMAGSVRSATNMAAAGSINLTATPGLGKKFDGWTSSQWSGIRMANPLVYVPTGNVSIDATFVDGSFQLSRQLVQETTTGVRTTLETTTETHAAQETYATPDVTASAPYGYVFSHWECNPASSLSVDGSGQSWAVIAKDTSLVGVFKPVAQLTITHVGSGVTSLSRISATSSQVFGSQVVVTVEPSAGVSFDHWSGANKAAVQVVGTNTYKINMVSTNMVLVAHFTSKLRLTVNTPNGSTNLPAEPLYAPGTVVSFTVNPDQPYRFSSWSGPDVQYLVGNGSTVSILMNQNREVTANFVKIQHPVTVTASAGGTATPPSGAYDLGKRLTIIATPDAGYSFLRWTGTGVVSVENPYSASTIATVSGPVDIQAVFAAQRSTSLQVTVSPTDVANTVFWRAIGPSSTTWQAAGTTVGNLAPGDYQLQFSDAPNYLTPNITITLGAEDAVTRNVQFYARTASPAFASLELLKLTAVPDVGYLFESWSGRSVADLVSLPVAAPRAAASLLMNGPKEISAAFGGKTYTLTLRCADTKTNQPITSVAPVVLTLPANGAYRLWGAGPRLPPGASYRQVYGGSRLAFIGPHAGEVVYSGSAFSGIAFAESIVMTGNKEIWLPYEPVYRLNIAVTPNNAGYVTWLPSIEANIASVTGEPQIPFNASPNFKVVSNIGYVFKSWGGADVDRVTLRYDPSTNIGPFSRDLDLTLTFEAKNVSLTVKTENGLIPSVTTSHPVNSAARVDIPDPKPGYVFDSWFAETGVVNSTIHTIGNMGRHPLNLTMTENAVITARFVPAATLVLSSNPPAATATSKFGISGATYVEDGNYRQPVTVPIGTVVGLRAPTAPVGYRFLNWSGSTSTLQSTTAAETLVTMDGDKALVANYAGASNSVTVETSNGKVATDTRNVPSGATIYFIPTAPQEYPAPGLTADGTAYYWYVEPQENYLLFRWEGANQANLVPTTVANSTVPGLFTAPNPRLVVNGNQSVKAIFTPARSITLASAGHGTQSFNYLFPYRTPETAAYITYESPTGAQISNIRYNLPIKVADGSVVAIYPFYHSGYQFHHWEGLPAENPTPTTTTQIIVVRSDLTITSYFSEITTVVDERFTWGPDNLLLHTALWLRPEELPNVAVGSSVGAWPDASGRHRDAMQSTATRQPTLQIQSALNDRKVLRFDGNDDTLAFPETTLRSLFIVAYSPSTGLRNIFGHTSRREIYAGYPLHDVIGVFGGHFIEKGTASLVGPDSSPFVQSGDAWLDEEYIAYGGTANTYGFDSPIKGGGHIYSFVFYGDVKADLLTGQPGNGIPWLGDYAEVIAFDRTLTDSEATVIRQYLYNKYFLKRLLYQSRSYGGMVNNYGSRIKLIDSYFCTESIQSNHGLVSIVATPIPGYDFKGWTGDSTDLIADVNSSNTTVQMERDTVWVHAQFHPKPADVTVVAAGSSDPTITGFLNSSILLSFLQINLDAPDPAVERLSPNTLASMFGRRIAAGTGGTYTGVRATTVSGMIDTSICGQIGFRFSHWSGPGIAAIQDRAAPQFSVHADPGVPLVLYANFVAISDPAAQATLTVTTSGQGSVTPETASVSVGTSVNVVATPATGYSFAFWSGSLASLLNDYLSPNATLLVTLNGNLTAHFMRTPVTLNVTHTTGGTTTPEGANLFEKGTTQEITATPLQGYTFVAWSGDVAGIDPLQASVVTTLTGDKTLHATFSKQYQVQDLWGLTLKLPAQTWEQMYALLGDAILAGDTQPQASTSAGAVKATTFTFNTGTVDVIPNWMQLETVDGQATLSLRKDYWSHLTDPILIPSAVASSTVPFVRVSSPTNPVETQTIEMPTVEVSDDAIVLGGQMEYVPAATLVDQERNRYYVLRSVSDQDGTQLNSGYQTPNTDITSRANDRVAGNEEIFQLTVPHPVTSSDLNVTPTLLNEGLSVFPAEAARFVSVVNGRYIAFDPPSDFGPVLVTYYVTETRGTGLLDPEGMRTQGLLTPFYKADGTFEQRAPCWKTPPAGTPSASTYNNGYTTCWGQLRLRVAGSNRLPDPMENGAAVRASATRATADFSELAPNFISDIYPGGEKVSGLSAYYILRTVACYFIPGNVSKANAAYGCDQSGEFAATASSQLCDNPQVNGYQRCIAGYCDWYAYVPAHIACVQASGSSFTSIIGTAVQIDNVLSGSQTCVKLPCPKRTSNCTP